MIREKEGDMRYFYAALAIITAILLLVKQDMALEIIATALVIAGIIGLLPTE